MKRILIAINPAHKLTEDQLSELKNYQWIRLQIVDPDLCQAISNITDQDVEETYWKWSARLSRLADDFDAVILPISSPAFMFRFALELGLNNNPQCLDKYFFAHSQRDSKEVDGKKVSVFAHQRFFNLRGVSLRDAIKPSNLEPFTIKTGEGVIASVDEYMQMDRCVGNVFEALKPGQYVQVQEGVFILDEDLDLL